MRVSKTANKQRERERERENRNSLRYDFLGAFLLRDNSSAKSSGDGGFHYEREREREREREKDFLDWDFAPPLIALPHKNKTSS